MKKLPAFILNCSIFALLPVIADAAGTYYNAGYGNNSNYAQRTNNYYNAPARNTNAPYYQGSASSYKRSGGYGTNANSSYASRMTNSNAANRYASQSNAQTRPQTAKNTASGPATSSKGFWLDAGITHEIAQWKFEMKTAGSILHYDNIGWNVFGARGGYVFDLGNTRGQIDFGVKYGIQSGESSMVDDDITNGGYLVDEWFDDVDENGIYDPSVDSYLGDTIAHALSVGKSDGGNMMEFNAGFSLKDFFTIGNLRMTPSIGYRYLKYKLETKNNYGMAIDTSKCFELEGGEIQCDPALIFVSASGEEIVFRPKIDEMVVIPSGAVNVDTGGTYYYEQSGVSHSYEVEWAGPYLAMDMDYTINQNNAVNGRIELGLPGYTATGDQPYRFDWQHPKSVEDKADMFGAFHLGLGANYMTAINDRVSLSFGFTFDYYSVGDADANTYLNGDYYMDYYNMLLTEWAKTYPDNTEDYMLGLVPGVAGSPTAIGIKQQEADCPGWVCKATGEIESFYKSMGIRVGINAKF